MIAMDGIHIGVTEQLATFGFSCLIGAGLGIFYDFFRVLRKAIPHNWAFIGVEDLIFFIAATTYSFNFMVSVLDGRIRFFIIIGELLGWIIYFFTLGVVVMGVSDKIIACVKYIITALIRIFIAPIFSLLRWLLVKLRGIVILLVKNFKKSTKYSKIRLKRRSILMYNYSKARAGSYRRSVRNRRK